MLWIQTLYYKTLQIYNVQILQKAGVFVQASEIVKVTDKEKTLSWRSNWNLGDSSVKRTKKSVLTKTAQLVSLNHPSKAYDTISIIYFSLLTIIHKKHWNTFYEIMKNIQKYIIQPWNLTNIEQLTKKVVRVRIHNSAFSW